MFRNIAGETVGVDEFAVLEEHSGLDRDMTNRSILTTQTGRIFTQRLVTGQPAKNILNDWFIGMKLGDVPAGVFLFRVAEKIKPFPIVPPNYAVGVKPVPSHASWLHAITKHCL